MEAASGPRISSCLLHFLSQQIKELVVGWVWRVSGTICLGAHSVWTDVLPLSLTLPKCLGFNPQKQPVTRTAFVWCTRPVIPVTQDQNELSSMNTVNQIPSFRIKALAKPLSCLLPWTKSGHYFGNADLFHGSPAKIFQRVSTIKYPEMCWERQLRRKGLAFHWQGGQVIKSEQRHHGWSAWCQESRALGPS